MTLDLIWPGAPGMLTPTASLEGIADYHTCLVGVRYGRTPHTFAWATPRIPLRMRQPADELVALRQATNVHLLAQG